MEQILLFLLFLRAILFLFLRATEKSDNYLISGKILLL